MQLLIESWKQYLNENTGASFQDITDALEHMSDFEESPLKIENFKIKFFPKFKLEDLSDYDDLSSWPEWNRGELLDLDENEFEDELIQFRGNNWTQKAKTWIKNPKKIPPIVIVITKTMTGIGDGRGRVSLALGLDWETIPTTILTENNV